MNGLQANDQHPASSASSVVHQHRVTSEFGTDEQQMTVRVVPPSHDHDHDDDDDRNFITQVNVPSGRRHTCGGGLDSFSTQLVVDNFSETVSVPVLGRPSAPRQSCASFCNYESARRYKESMRLEPSLAAAQFDVSMVCYPDSTKKRYRTTVHCATKLRPRHFGATSFIQPKHKEDRFISYVDYGQDSTRRWHTTAVTVRPRTGCSTFVRGFQFSDGAWSGDDSLDDLESCGSSGFLEDEGGSSVGPGQSDLELNLSNGDLGKRNGYRAHMVVGGE